MTIRLAPAPFQSAQQRTDRADTVRVRQDSLADSTRARRAQSLEAVQVTAVRGHTGAIPEKTITRSDIQRRYTGQETPILLQSAPGMTAYSESGSASNYSYIRLRGIDQTRINITLDGIPLNEPEDEALYFSNFPDFANSIASVQVQRGVGSSTHGTASYAGSVNFESVPVAAVDRQVEVQLTEGSYNTTRGSVSAQSGLTASGFAGYVRGSAQHTDGYRFNSGNSSRSTFMSGGWFGAQDIIKVSLLAGLSSNEQAYLASPLSVLLTTPRDNPYGNARDEAVLDRFHQDLLSAAWTHAISPATSVATTVYGFDAGGWYDVPGTNGLSDASHYDLHSRWGGVISALDWQGAGASGSIGVNVARYNREHWLLERPDLVTRDYDNTGFKGEQSVFAKGALVLAGATVSADVQLRTVQFRYQPTAGSGVSPASTSWSFINPKLGVSVPLSTAVSAFASVGANSREPTRSDMFAGADDVDSVTAHSVFPLTRVRPERAFDVESGVNWRVGGFSGQANVFLMQFHDEIAAIGVINEIGYELRKNVDRSMRRGIEADATWQLSPMFTALGNVSVTEARIDEYRDDSSGNLYANVTPLMTPKFISNQGIRSTLASWLLLDVDGRYVSRMMLTNTDDPRFTVPDSWFADVGATVRVLGESALIQVRNVFNRTIYTGGYPGAAAYGNNPNAMEAYYYPLAPRNVAVNLRLAF